jgi:hypothetical protein
MTELDLLNLARSTTANEVSMFGEVIAINFAMIVAIYYFLHQARLTIRIFAFIAYSFGSALYLGQMLIEANVKAVVITSLAAMPPASISAVTRQYLAVTGNWLGHAVSFLFNGAFYILWLGVFYLLFFWQKLPSAGQSDTGQ